MLVDKFKIQAAIQKATIRLNIVKDVSIKMLFFFLNLCYTYNVSRDSSSRIAFDLPVNTYVILQNVINLKTFTIFCYNVLYIVRYLKNTGSKSLVTGR